MSGKLLLGKPHSSGHVALGRSDGVGRSPTGRLNFEDIRFNLGGTIERTLDLLGKRAKEKKVELILNYESDVPTRLIGDPNRIPQAVRVAEE